MFKTSRQFLFFFLGLIFLWASDAQTAPRRIDLAVDTVQLQPPRRLDSNTVITVVLTVKNNGFAGEVGSFPLTVVIEADGKIVKKIPDIPVLSKLPSSGVGLAIPVEIGLLPEGNYTVEVIVDAGNLIKETNEKNNSKRKDFRVWSPPYQSVTYSSYRYDN